MGSGQSSQGHRFNGGADNAYDHLLSIEAGCDVCPKLGGAEEEKQPSKMMRELSDYSHTVSARTKKELFSRIVSALGEMGVKVDESGDPEEIVKEIKRLLPSPGGERKFSESANDQKKICKLIADAFNKTFAYASKGREKIIDTNASPEIICRQVHDLIYSLGVGLQTEFLEVYASLSNVIKNIEMLNEVMDKMVEKIAESSDPNKQFEEDIEYGRTNKLRDYIMLYDKARDKRTEQIMLLKNLLSVTLPDAQKLIAEDMRKLGEHTNIVKELSIKPGTSQFSDILAMAVSDWGTIAAMSNIVDKSLKTVGMSLSKYKELGDPAALEREIKELEGKISPKDLEKFVVAASTLRTYFKEREDLEEMHEGLTEKERRTLDSGKVSGTAESSSVRGAAEGEEDKMTKMEYDIKTKKRRRAIVVQEFMKELSRSYKGLAESIKKIGPMLGNKIKITPDIERLRQAFIDLSVDTTNMNTREFNLMLLGVYSDASSKEKKGTFISSFRLMLRIVDDIISTGSGAREEFSTVKSNIEHILKTIDLYSESMKKSGGEYEEVEGGVEEYGKEDFSELLTRSEIPDSGYQLNKAVSEIVYYFYVAQVRRNLKQTASELSVYGSKYEQMLGDSVATKINKLKEDMETNKKEAPTDASKAFIQNIYNCKINFYRVLQAIDLYLKNFTDGIVSNPDDINDIKKILDGVTLIGNWYNEKSGDLLAQVFDIMPAEVDLVGYFDNITKNPSDRIWNEDGAHYYNKLKTADINTNQWKYPGDPIFPLLTGILKNDGDKFIDNTIKKRIQEVYKNFQALKNILNAFVRIGDKLGGRRIRKEVFMSPSEIFNSLTQFLICSSLSRYKSNNEDDPTPETTVSNDTVVHSVLKKQNELLKNANNNKELVSKTSVKQVDSEETYNTNLVKASFTFSSVFNTITDDFETEDKYFSFAMKSICAKILTVVGVYDLFNNPTPYLATVPVRMIIGGYSAHSMTKAIPEAAELYFRLPRLIEFYQKIFNLKDVKDAKAISMIPEIEGIFSGIINLLFVKWGRLDASTKIITYSNSEMRSMIEEINSIYEHFKDTSGEESVTEKAIMAFVREINRRFGVIQKKDYEEYIRFLRKARSGEPEESSQTSYSILPDEDEGFEARRRAPSDRFMAKRSQQSQAISSLLDFEDFRIPDMDSGATFSLYDKLKKLVNKMDEFLSKNVGSNYGRISYRGVIEQSIRDMKNVSGQDEKVEIAFKLIQGSRRLINFDVNKAIMVHETIVLGLNTLYGIYKILDNVRSVTDKVDVDFIIGKLAAQGDPDDASLYRLRENYANSDNMFLRPGLIDAGVNRTITFNNLFDAIRDAIGEGDVTGNRNLLLSVRTDLIMEDILRLVLGLSSSFKEELVTVRFPNTTESSLYIDFSGLKGKISDMMDDVRYFIDRLRPSIPSDLLKQIEDKSKEGSYYWLEEKLMDGFVRNVTDVVEPAEGTRKDLDYISSTLDKSFTELTKPYDYKYSRGAFANETYIDKFGSVLARIVYYDSGTQLQNRTDLKYLPIIPEGDTIAADVFGSGTLMSFVGNKPANIGDPRTAPVTATVAGNNNNINKFLGDVYGRRGDDLYTGSLLTTFNSLLYRYLYTFYDQSSRKIFRGLIENIGNGSLSRQIMEDGYSMPDLYYVANPRAANSGNFGVRGDPDNGVIVAQSLARIIRHLLVEYNDRTQTQMYTINMLSDIPEYIKENMRANLPYFMKQFTILQKRGNLLKQIMDQTVIDISRDQLFNARNDGNIYTGYNRDIRFSVVDNNGGADIVLAANNEDILIDGKTSSINSIQTFGNSKYNKVDMKSLLYQIIDSINSGSMSVNSSIETIMRELADDPKYLELEKNFISTFRSLNGKMPFMPLSSSVILLVDNAGRVPDKKKGGYDFKILYGSRKLLGQDGTVISLSDAPGVEHILESYNGTAGDLGAVSKDKFEKFLGNYVSMARYMFNMRASYMSSDGKMELTEDERGRQLHNNLKLVGKDDFTESPKPEITVYQLKPEVNLQDVVSLTESSDVEISMSSVAKDIKLNAGDREDSRDTEIARNIVDMGIIPINLHALMRDIPFVHLYNYSMTFDRMACLMYGVDCDQLCESKFEDLKNTREAFLKLLIEPYCHVPKREYDRDFYSSLISRIFVGDDSLSMGRPKFLNDQLFNKVLLNSTYQPYDEAGPKARKQIKIEGKLDQHLNNLYELLTKELDLEFQTNNQAALLYYPTEGEKKYLDKIKSYPKDRRIADKFYDLCIKIMEIQDLNAGLLIDEYDVIHYGNLLRDNFSNVIHGRKELIARSGRGYPNFADNQYYQTVFGNTRAKTTQIFINTDNINTSVEILRNILTDIMIANNTNNMLADAMNIVLSTYTRYQLSIFYINVFRNCVFTYVALSHMNSTLFELINILNINNRSLTDLTVNAYIMEEVIELFIEFKEGILVIIENARELAEILRVSPGTYGGKNVATRMNNLLQRLDIVKNAIEPMNDLTDASVYTFIQETGSLLNMLMVLIYYSNNIYEKVNSNIRNIYVRVYGFHQRLVAEVHNSVGNDGDALLNEVSNSYPQLIKTLRDYTMEEVREFIREIVNRSNPEDRIIDAFDNAVEDAYTDSPLLFQTTKDNITPMLRKIETARFNENGRLKFLGYMGNKYCDSILNVFTIVRNENLIADIGFADYYIDHQAADQYYAYFNATYTYLAGINYILAEVLSALNEKWEGIELKYVRVTADLYNAVNPEGRYRENIKGVHNLSYIKELTDRIENPQDIIEHTNVERDIILATTSFRRFNTTLVRNLIFITNLHRLIRLKLNQELTQYRNVVVTDHGVVNMGVTEFGFTPPQFTHSYSLSKPDGPPPYIPKYDTQKTRLYEEDREYRESY